MVYISENPSFYWKLAKNGTKEEVEETFKKVLESKEQLPILLFAKTILLTKGKLKEVLDFVEGQNDDFYTLDFYTLAKGIPRELRKQKLKELEEKGVNQDSNLDYINQNLDLFKNISI